MRSSWLFNTTGKHSPRGLLFDTFLNGTHPLLPWLAFLCAGMILARHLPASSLRLKVAMVGGLGRPAADLRPERRVRHDGAAVAARLFATDPFSRSLNYTIGTLGSSVAAFAAVSLVCRLARRRRPSPESLAAAGRMTLTVYVLHALVFNLVVHVLGWVRPTGLDTAWLLTRSRSGLPAIVLAAWWQRHLGLGPLERVYRRFGGDEPQPAHPFQARRRRRRRCRRTDGGSPEAIPTFNHSLRWAEVPCVNESGSTFPPPCDWM